MRRVFVDVDSWPTECIVVDATKSVSPSSSPVLVVVPGNPGNILFYEQFLLDLHQRTGGRSPIIGVSHAGHCGTLTTDQVVSLDDQIVHKQRFLELLFASAESDVQTQLLLQGEGRRTRSNVTRREVILLGHSIGAYICLKALVRDTENSPSARLPVRRVINCCPTIRHLYEGLKPFVRVAIQPGVRHLLANMLHYSPVSLRRLILSASNDMSDEARYVTADRLSYSLIMNVLSMAHEESLVVREIDDEIVQCIEEHSDKLHFVYSNRDSYTPLHFVDELKDQFAGTLGEHQVTVTDCKHAFVLEPTDNLVKLFHDLNLLH